MRIERLDLIAYGVFDGFSLDGLGEPGVHLVHGPNEAGKSTTRGALDELLYGIERNSRHAFRHKGGTRLGARLATADGVVLEIIRQKKRGASLLDGTGRPIGQEALAPFLGGIDRKTFTTEFALDSEELRKGGQLLASGTGDMAQMLAAARSGTRLNAVLREIETRQRALYLRRGQKPSINEALAKWREAKRRKEAAFLHPDEYRKAKEAVAVAEKRLKAITDGLRNARRRQQELQRLHNSLPALDQLRELEKRIEEIKDEGPVAPDDIRAALPELISQRSEHNGTLTAHSRSLLAVEEQLAKIVAGEELLPHEADIERLAAELEAVLEAVTRQKNSSGEALRIRREAESLLQTVHPHATLDDTHLYRIPRGLLEEGRRLRDQGLGYRQDLHRTREELDRWRLDREEAEKRLSGLPLAEDVSQLQAAHDAVPRDVLTTLSETEARLERQGERFRRLLAELGLPDMSPVDALLLRVPERRQVEAAEARDHELGERERDVRAEHDHEQRQLADRRRKLNRLVSEIAPPTHDELRALRDKRDELIGLLSGDPTRLPLAVAAVQKADEAADTMLRHAQQVEKRLLLEREIADLEENLPHHQTALDEVDRLRAEARKEWKALWEAFPSDPPPIARAARVLERLDQLKGVAEELRDTHIDLNAQRRRLEGHTARLRQLLRVSDTDPQITGDAAVPAILAELMEMAATRLAAHRADADTRAEAERELTHAEARFAEADAAMTTAQERLAEHDRRWRRFLKRACLPEDRDFDTAIADLERLFKVAEDVDRAEDVERTARLDSQRIAEFEEALESTLRSCDRPVPVGPTGWRQCVGSLARDMEEQRDAARQRAEKQERLQEFKAEIDEARAELDRIESRLRDFTTRLGLPSDTELEPAVRRAEDLRQQGTALIRVKDTLPGGQELALLLQQAGQTTLPELRAELTELGEQIEKLEEGKTDATKRLAELQQELNNLNGGADAARAAADAAQICAGLADEAEEYLRLETARLAIVACMEEYRNNDQDPVLARASEVFRELTGGRYSGLGSSGGDRPSIRATTNDDDLLSPAELSEGTRDQLYLALRLATLERHAKSGHTLPVAVDDIFMTFDERRTEAALRVLDGMVDRFQVIVFTHHEHVVQSAVKVLPEGRCHVHQLPHVRQLPH